ncbi:cobyrinic acid a,c-diamide synthase [Salipaludibacillus keqinensis]|uniref:Cobyrinic acid a,c-diamide synthase n=1 Tax=Salipaludibacillus keqinensis TaxID=2045207 RepID=A0A323TDH9_9BACI|nr:MinD/ParA family protein [Salipaludibacillus keqinensis]PYZ93128.1 cobyrinic acid a,c-diamide synthase [Salipaludibacillus keqinensis]
MHDQADALRHKMIGTKLSSTNEGRNGKVIAVVSGKGGVGKSNFVVNFSLGLQKKQKKVLIIDLDIGMANIDILLGQSSAYSIVDMIEREMSIWSVIEKGPLGLSYVAGGSGLSSIFEMDREKAEFFFNQMESLQEEFDYIFLDMGAGVTSSSTHFILSAHEIFLVTTPEPTSITDAYGMIKYIDIQDAKLPISIIINRAHSKKDSDNTSRNVINVTKQFLNKDLSYLTTLPDDEIVWKSVRSQKPFMLFAPRSKPSIAIEKAIQQYLNDNPFDQTKEKLVPSFVAKLKKLMRKS